MATRDRKDNSVTETKRLMEISRSLSSPTTVEELADTLGALAMSLTGSRYAVIALVEEKTNALQWASATGERTAVSVRCPEPPQGGIAARVLKAGKPLVINNVDHHPRAGDEIQECFGLQGHTLLAVPISSAGEGIGVLKVLNKEAPGGYRADDVTLVQALADLAGPMIEARILRDELDITSAEVDRLDRMKSDFIAIASHELRTPLGLILGHATFIQDYVPEEYSEQMEVIIRSAMRLKELIEDMSAIAHKDQGAARVRGARFDLSQLVQSVVERFAQAAEAKDVELSSDVQQPGVLMVDGDRDKIDVVIDNLIKNAINFTDAKGQVGVKAEESEGYAQVFVVDTGIGIPADEVDRVFERFYQVESHLTRKHGGMGLGLSIAKAMVEMHNGQIWCESKEDVGSLFCVMLPMTEDKAHAASRIFKTA